jgi:pantoate kinase
MFDKPASAVALEPLVGNRGAGDVAVQAVGGEFVLRQAEGYPDSTSSDCQCRPIGAERPGLNILVHGTNSRD